MQDSLTRKLAYYWGQTAPMGIFRNMFNDSSEEPEDKSQNNAEQPETQANADDGKAQPDAEPTLPTGETIIDESVITSEVSVVVADPPPPPTGKEQPATTPPHLDISGVTRRLPMEDVISQTRSHLLFGQLTDVGLVRDENQDAVTAFYATSHSVDELPMFGFFIVADGMGGHNDGRLASSTTVRVVSDKIIKSVYLPLISGAGMSELPPMNDTLAKAIEKANSEVRKVVQGGGTTCTSAVILGDRVYIGHVGDSRAYVIYKDMIEQLTRDHSVAQRLVEVGQLTEEEANEANIHELYRALGWKEKLEVDINSRRLQPNSMLVLCSDGLWNLVDDYQIRDIVLENDDPQDAATKLVALANTKGGSDNISVIVVHIN